MSWNAGQGHMTAESPDNGCLPTEYESFLYLRIEMERAVERGRISWPADQSSIIQSRLLRIAKKVAQASHSAPPPLPPLSAESA